MSARNSATTSAMAPRRLAEITGVDGRHLVAANDSSLAVRLADIRADLQRVRVPDHNFYPVKPWHIQSKEFARESLRFVRVIRRIPGICHTQPYWAEFKQADLWVKEALRAHLFAKGLTASQNFGSALKGRA